MRAHRSFAASVPQHGHTASISNLALGVTARIRDLAATPASAITAYDITLVGLYDDGFRDNRARFINNTAEVAGQAFRSGGINSYNAWLYSNGNTQQIGLTGAAHARDDSYQAKLHNILGQAAGYAERFDGAAYAGQSAWFYDPLTNQTYSTDAAAPVPMTYSDRYIMYLGNDGLALRYYSRFDAGGTNLGNGAFSFSVADGQNDLGSLVNGGLDAAGWQQLGEAYRANSAGQIIGNGHLASMNGGAVFLLPPYPNPKPGPGCWPAWGWQGLPCGGAGRVRFDAPGVQQHTEYMTAEGGYK